MTKIHVARFGNKNNQHAVVSHSGISSEVLRSLVWRTDAPPESSGLGLDSFVSAFRLGDLYVVQTTRADIAGPRSGMVTTNAALVPIESVNLLDLRAMWILLDREDLEVETMLRFDELMQQAADGDSHVHAPGASAIASSILRDQPLAWVGPGLHEAIECVWLHLRPYDRARLVVGAAAHPARLSIPTEADSAVVFRTAQSVVSRWSDSTIVSATTTPPKDAARDAMFGDDAGRSAALAKRLEVDNLAGRSWRHLATATGMLDDLSKLDHESCRALLQLFGLLQPDLARGKLVKEEGLRRLQDLTREANFVDMRGLRGLPWTALGVNQCIPLLNDWCANVVTEPSRTKEVIEAIVTLQSVVHDAFYNDFDAALSLVVTFSFVERLATAAMKDERGLSVFQWLVKCVTELDKLDRAFTEAAPNTARLPDWLHCVAIEFQLARLHATIVDVSNAVSAWQEHLSLKPRLDDADGILVGRTTEAGVVAAALAIDDYRLTSAAAKAVRNTPGLLASAPVGDPRTQAVWLEAVGLGSDPWDLIEPSKAVTPLLDLLVAGKDVDHEMLESLSKTTAADIGQYERRADVWSALPRAALAGFRSATAASLSRSYRSIDTPPEHLLQNAMFDIDLLASIAKESAPQSVELILGLPLAQARNAIVVIRSARFDPVTEHALASFIVSRRWRSVADVIIAESATRPDLRAAAQRVSSLYRPLDRVIRFFGGGVPAGAAVSSSDLKAAFVDAASQLYVDGPKSDSLWQRAGGDEADLKAARTGRLAWGQAIDSCVVGRRGAPALADLLREMIEDFPKSTKLQAIKNAIENGLS